MKKYKILVADDDPDILEVMTVVLEDKGYEVTAMLQPGLLYEELSWLPDIFLLDVYLSGDSGSEICRKIKLDPALKHIPVILLSAHSELNRICADCGANDFLSKPFKIQDLLDKVEKHVYAGNLKSSDSASLAGGDAGRDAGGDGEGDGDSDTDQTMR